ncbi:hypothetical protein G210_5183 [Candida maltosa Xu316]|uniref:Uncharacterized protein n=1 Tax=Candida maltosa (strain Xu316) TaxID=1245528 RepID=M3JSI8_CANMX|nr:hypothetical protein G210_5183 [Candida maltosa Xu316]
MKIADPKSTITKEASFNT